MNTFKTITGERVTLHGDHIVIEETPIEDVVLAVYDDMQRCERCGDWVDNAWIADGICGHCHDALTDWDRGVTYRDIYGED